MPKRLNASNTTTWNIVTGIHRERSVGLPVQDAGEEKVKWYKWDGTSEEWCIKEVCLQRHQYDAFQNTSCPAISQSKLTCNTNFSTIIEGPVGGYNFKYAIKSTQKQDIEDYGNISEVARKVLSKVHEGASNNSVAMRCVLAASFANQKTNVVGASLASFFTRICLGSNSPMRPLGVH